MTKPNYPYPEDEFDQAALHAGPRGVHRQPRAGLRRWWPFLAVLVLAPALAFAFVTFLSHSGTSSKIPGFSSLTEDSTASGAPSQTSSPTASATASATPTTTPTTPTAAGPALGTKIQVLNGAAVNGAAGKASAKLTAAGFTSVTSGNYGGAALSVSTVFYATPADAVTAKAVGTALGIAQVKESATQASGAIVVVLKSDYKP